MPISTSVSAWVRVAHTPARLHTQQTHSLLHTMYIFTFFSTMYNIIRKSYCKADKKGRRKLQQLDSRTCTLRHQHNITSGYTQHQPITVLLACLILTHYGMYWCVSQARRILTYNQAYTHVYMRNKVDIRLLSRMTSGYTPYTCVYPRLHPCE